MARARRALLVSCTVVVVAALAAGCTPPPSGPPNVPPAPAPATTVPQQRHRVAVVNGQLTLDGTAWTPVGVNAYSLATQWGTNPGCGTMYRDDQLDEFFASMPRGTLVRTWAFQGSMATNIHTGQRDWTGLDKVVRAAERHGALLVLTLTNQSGGCDDGHWKDPQWYRGGYRDRWPGDGYTRTATSFDTYLTEVVSRYKSSTAIAMWEPVNEPEGAVCAPPADGDDCWRGHLSCPDADEAAAAMRVFFDTIGERIEVLDPGRLVSSGALGGPQCGWEQHRYSVVHASAGIDVAGYHDYSRAVEGDALFTDRAARATAIGKPLLVGELGVEAGPSCRSTTDRAAQLDATVTDRLARGAAGVLLWNRDLAVTSSCDMTLLPDDPALAGLSGATR